MSTNTNPKDWYAKHKPFVFGSCAAIAAAYAAYRLYNSGSISKTQTRLSQLSKILSDYSSAASSLSTTVSTLTADLNTYLTNDTEELPQSLKQLSKLFQSQEVQDTLQAAVSSCAKGLSQATASQAGDTQRTAIDTILEAVVSDRGRSLIGMAVGLAARNSTAAFCEFLQARLDTPTSSDNPSFTLQEMLNLLISEKGERLLSLLITKSIKTGVSTYVDATAGYNMYEDLLVSISKQEHRDAISDITTRVTATFCREIATAYRKAKAAPANVANQSSAASNSTAASSAPSSSLQVTVLATQPESAPSRSSLDGEPSSVGALRPRSRSIKDLTSRVNTLTRVPLPMAPTWLKQLAELAKEQDVRSLAVEVAKSASREATKGAVEGFFQTSHEARDVSLVSSASLNKMYVLLCLTVSMFMYAISPRLISL